MQCKQCGNNLVRGFTFCLECGMPVPDELLEESGLPPRNIDSGPKAHGVGESAEREEEAPAKPNFAPEPEQQGDLKPRYIGGGEDDRGAALKPQFIGGDTGVGGRDLKPKLMGLGEETSGKALKPQYIGGGESDSGRGEQVKVVLHETSSETDSVSEKLVFCPNCGMHMQHNPNICDICGMLLGNKPTNVPTSQSGMPLFNTDGDAFSGGFGGLGEFGGLGGFGEVDGLSDDDISRADSFASGNNDPLFNNEPVGLGSLSEQLAGFSATAGSRSIGVTENTRIRQKAVEKGKDLEVEDFLLTDDLSSESVPMSTEGVPVVGDYSMEDNPDEELDLDPFRFVGMSMDEAPEEPFVKKRSGLGASSAAFEKPEPISPSLEDLAPKFTRASDPEPIIPKIAGIEEIAPKPQPAPTVTEKTAEPALEEIRVENKAQAPAEAPKKPESKKKCYACGHMMPSIDRYCPFCGRSTFGAPSPNDAANEPAPAPKKRSVLPFILILIIAVAAAIVGTMYFTHSGIFSAEGLQLTVDSFKTPLSGD